MFIKEDKKSNGATSVRIVESKRIGGKCVQKTLRTLGQHKDEKELEIIRKAAERLIIEIKNSRNPVLPIFNPEDIYRKGLCQLKQVANQEVKIGDLVEEHRINDGIFDVYGKFYKELGFNRLISGTRQDKKWNSALEACVLARVAQPSSKLKTSKLLDESFNIKIDLDHIYRMMSHVGKQEENIKSKISKQTQELFQTKVDVLLFDVTTLYFESVTRDELRNFGFSKDCKFNNTQVVLALMTTTDGTPVGYELFPGNTSEGKTLIAVIEKVKKSFGLDNIVLVADRAMFSSANLEYLQNLGVKYVVAAKLKSLKRTRQEAILNSRTFQIREIMNEAHWVNDFALTEEQRLIVSYSSVRAKKDIADRERILDKLRNKANCGKLRVTDLVGNSGSRQYITVSEKVNASIDENKIFQKTRWDGLHGIITNVKDKSASELLTRYRDLWKIEEAFRVNKHDLRLRPIYHWKPERIKAHVAICYVAFALLSYAKIKLKKQKLNISLETLKEELIKSQSSILKDKKTNTIFSIPSKITDLQRKIYSAFSVERRQIPQIIN